MQLTIKRLSVETLHDFLDYFDHRAFLRDEDWAGCYCQAYLHPPTTKEEDVFGPGKARQSARDLVSEGNMDGYLAYQEKKVVAWCAAGSSKLYRALPDADDKLARLICFNVDPDMREQGIASDLLDLVLRDLESRGFAAVEAAPSKAEVSDKSFQGTIAMFEKRGFEKITEINENQVLMRKHLD